MLYLVSKTLVLVILFVRQSNAQECVSGTADVVLVIDESTSVGRSNFNIILSFLSGLIDELNIGPSDVQVACLTFSNRVTDHFYLNRFRTKQELKSAIEGIRHEGGGTDIATALQHAFENYFFLEHGARNEVQKIVVLVIDGMSPDTENIAQTMRSANITIMTLGITDQVTVSFLESISGSSSLAFHVDQFAGLSDVRLLFSQAVCQATVQVIDHCLSSPCLNGGPCVSNDTTYSCLCPNTFTGIRCENDVDECLTQLHDCEQYCSNTEGGFICRCPKGYILAEDSKTCEDVNECMAADFVCADDCVNTRGSFYCICRPGYKLAGDKRTCEDINECTTELSECEQNCINTDGSFRCDCNHGYILGSDESSCKDINECLDGMHGCEHRCKNTNGSFSCTCQNGYSLNNDSKSCSLIKTKVEGRNDSSDILIPLVAGLTLVGIILAATAVFILIMFRKRRSRSAEPEDTSEKEMEEKVPLTNLNKDTQKEPHIIERN